MNKYEMASPWEPKLKKLPMLISGEKQDCYCLCGPRNKSNGRNIRSKLAAEYTGCGAKPMHILWQEFITKPAQCGEPIA